MPNFHLITPVNIKPIPDSHLDKAKPFVTFVTRYYLYGFSRERIPTTLLGGLPTKDRVTLIELG